MDAYGLRLRLRLEGSENEADDVWVYFLSNNVHQLGWGKKNNFKLNIPSGKFFFLTIGLFTYSTYKNYYLLNFKLSGTGGKLWARVPLLWDN